MLANRPASEPPANPFASKLAPTKSSLGVALQERTPSAILVPRWAIADEVRSYAGAIRGQIPGETESSARDFADKIRSHESGVGVTL